MNFTITLILYHNTIMDYTKCLVCVQIKLTLLNNLVNLYRVQASEIIIDNSYRRVCRSDLTYDGIGNIADRNYRTLVIYVVRAQQLFKINLI